LNVRERRGGSNQARWRRAAGHPITHLAAALLVVAVAQSFLLKVYQVPSASMDETLQPGDRLLVNRLAFTSAPPQAGDVVVFERPEGWDPGSREASPFRVMAGWIGDLFGFGPSNSDALVKRVIAEPGQTVGCCNDAGLLMRNGTPLQEPYVSSNLPFVPGSLDCQTTPRSSRCFAPLTVPDDRYLVLGDNRAASSDSVAPCRGRVLQSSLKCARLVPGNDIIGPAVLIFWPLSRWGGV
jgi:signal peptidase I